MADAAPDLTSVETPPDVRREHMLAYVGDHEYVPVADLSRRFAVSDVTVRSDLSVLARRGLVTRVRGGAMPSRRLVSERSFEETAARHPGEKAAIGRAAAGLVRDGESIAIDVGTTTAALAGALVRRADLEQVTIFTNGLRIAAELEAAVPRLTVVVTGGTLRPMQHSLVDPLASDVFDRIHPHIAFIGASAFDPERGVTNVNLPEAELKARMIRAAQRVVLLVDGSKIGQVDVARVCTTEEVDLLVTGPSAPSEVLEALDEHGVDALVVDDSPE